MVKIHPYPSSQTVGEEREQPRKSATFAYSSKMISNGALISSGEWKTWHKPSNIHEIRWQQHRHFTGKGIKHLLTKFGAQRRTISPIFWMLNPPWFQCFENDLTQDKSLEFPQHRGVTQVLFCSYWCVNLGDWRIFVSFQVHVEGANLEPNCLCSSRNNVSGSKLFLDLGQTKHKTLFPQFSTSIHVIFDRGS